MRYSSFSTTRARVILLFVLIVVLLVIASAAQANTRTTGGGELPYYARIEREYVVHTGEWAAIPFYRPPECAPDLFNLLDFYDFDAFDCAPPTTDGFIIWSGEPWASNPIQFKLHGLGAVPVWFVSWTDLDLAMEDDCLTVPELEGLPSLMKGSAGFYSETLHPTGAANNGMINIVANGNLPDGRIFFVHSVESNGVLNTRIDLQ